jgi:hypothetical protein
MCLKERKLLVLDMLCALWHIEMHDRFLRSQTAKVMHDLQLFTPWVTPLYSNRIDGPKHLTSR